MVALLPPYLKSRHVERQQFSTLLDTKVRFGQIYNVAVNVGKRDIPDIQRAYRDRPERVAHRNSRVLIDRLI